MYMIISYALALKVTALMDIQSVRCLINSMSRFIHLVACQTVKMVPIQKDYMNMVDMLKLLKPVLDEVVDSRVSLDEMLMKEIEELDIAINEAREFLEKWNPKMSKICSVLQSEPLAIKIQRSCIDICHILCIMLQSSPSTSQLVAVKHCLQELQCSDQERVSELIKEAMRDQKEILTPHSEILIKITESLGLTSNQELLVESVTLEKERTRSLLKELEAIDQIVNLIAHIRDWTAKLEQFSAINGVPIPPYFRCPLSLGLMLDPVIVASGQTYERAFIQRWLDHGLTICPKTRQDLAHANLITNYTVKDLIANWCEDNNIRRCDTANGNNASPLPISPNVPSQDFTRAESFRCCFYSNNSTPRSSLEAGHRSQKKKVGDSSKCIEDNSKVIPKCDQSSPGQSYIHSRTESASSAISSIEYLPPSFATNLHEASDLSSKHGHTSEFFGEVTSNCSVSSPSKEAGFSPWLSGRKYHSSKTVTAVADNGSNHQRSFSLPFSDSGFDDLTTSSHVEKLVEDLKVQCSDTQTTAAAELRLLAKHNMDNRLIIAHCGAIPPLISLLYSVKKLTQEHAVTTLLNLSINENNKNMIAEAGAIEPLIHVLKSGNAGAKENGAATLFSLSVLEEYKIKIGRSAAVKALVDLLESGTLRGKKDAATALFNLSIFHENKVRIVQAGAVKHLIELMDPDTGMIDKCVALLANLSTIPEGRTAITREGGIPLLVEVLETGSQRGKENAASILLQLCFNSQKFCTLVLQEGAVPPLVALSQCGTPRAKEKAHQILSHFRNQREGAVGKAK
ncbi:hypothetical protein IFM89_017996 [Coptis chinensis]|uniref:RING-type E3 ubiquitin transferase n=1 Tax=Coptis chinensis TaxID=261450 RepID=A0A835HYG4_9MAGN|nr:hypothetical protein IFM89_017996 [Coptis chinensis]